MAGQAALQQNQEIALPTPGTWEVDAAHSSVSFVARHLMVAKARGRFARFTGSLTIGDGPETSSVTASIDASSIDTAEPTRDAHLRSPDFLDVERFPTVEFRSVAARLTGPTTLEVDGELTIRDVTRPVALEVSYEGLTADPFGNERAVFSAETEIDREEWGITWNKTLETGGVLVGKRVKIELEIEAVRKP